MIYSWYPKDGGTLIKVEKISHKKNTILMMMMMIDPDAIKIESNNW